MKKMILLVTVLLIVVGSVPAQAGQVVRSGTSGFEVIESGVFDLGLDNMLLLRYHKTGSDASEVSTLNAVYFVGVTPRYFIGRNFALGLNVNWFYQRSTTKTTASEDTLTDTGVMGFLMANYFVRLGNSLFFKPGIGGGGFWGTRRVPAGAGLTAESTLVGGAARVDLGFVYYASQHFNLRAGFDVIMRFGTEKAEGADEGEGLLTADVGVSFGAGYSF